MLKYQLVQELFIIQPQVKRIKLSNQYISNNFLIQYGTYYYSKSVGTGTTEVTINLNTSYNTSYSSSYRAIANIRSARCNCSVWDMTASSFKIGFRITRSSGDSASNATFDWISSGY